MVLILAADRMPGDEAYELTEAPASRATASAMSTDELQDDQPAVESRLHKRTLLKLDFLLLPFLALFFLFNALDKTNVCYHTCTQLLQQHVLIPN